MFEATNQKIVQQVYRSKTHTRNSAVDAERWFGVDQTWIQRGCICQWEPRMLIRIVAMARLYPLDPWSGKTDTTSTCIPKADDP